MSSLHRVSSLTHPRNAQARHELPWIGSQALVGPATRRLGEAGSPGVTLEGPLAGVLRRAAYLYRQPTDQVRTITSAYGNAKVLCGP